MVNPMQGISTLVTASVENIKFKDKVQKEENKPNITTKVLTNTADKYSGQGPESPKSNSVLAEAKIVDYSQLSKKLQEIIGASNTYFEFSLDEETKKLIIKVVNQETKEVVQQYPPEVALKIAKIVAQKLDAGQLTNAVV